MSRSDRIATSALDSQVGGDHYKTLAIQPIEFSVRNNLNALQHTAIKYVVRRKGDRAKRVEDLNKAIHVLEMYREAVEQGWAE